MNRKVWIPNTIQAPVTLFGSIMDINRVLPLLLLVSTFRLSVGTWRLVLGTFRLAIRTFRMGVGTFRLSLNTFRLVLNTFRLALDTFRHQMPFDWQCQFGTEPAVRLFGILSIENIFYRLT